MILYYSTEYVINETVVAPEPHNSTLRIILFCILVVILLTYCFIIEYQNKKKNKVIKKVRKNSKKKIKADK